MRVPPTSVTNEDTWNAFVGQNYVRYPTRVSAANPADGWGPDGFAGGAGRARALPDC